MSKYEIPEGKFFFNRYSKEGVEQLTNFVARIKEEQIYHDGGKTTTLLVIDGTLHDGTEEGQPLPEITISATDFAGMGWISDRWGMRPIVYPVSSAERDLKTAIQINSTPERRHIYTHTGWADVNGKRTYLTTTGGIDAKGHHPDITVQLPHELSRYALPRPPKPEEGIEAFRNSLRLVNIGPAHVTWPLLLATYRAAVGPADFAVHLAGRTGTFKSEIASLFQSHFGSGMDARHLPASWSSTPNAIEALAYRACNCLMVLDDFVPVGTSYQVRNLQAAADKIIRAQGNQAGRSRLTDISSMQTTMYPRGLILSTGEDIPEGHSVRGRMLILEIQPGSIEPARLSEAQAKRDDYPQAMAAWVQWIAKNDIEANLRRFANEQRDSMLGLGHSRTPPILGQLVATAHFLLEFAADMKWLSVETVAKVYDKAVQAVRQAGERQLEHLETADPTNAFMETIRLLMTSNMAHLKTKAGGVPQAAERMGWTKTESAGALPSYKPNGPRLGWVDGEHGEVLIDPSIIALIKKHSGGKLAITPQTLLKRLKESGKLTRTDPSRNRNTIRVTCEGHPHQCLAFSLAEVLGDDD